MPESPRPWGSVPGQQPETARVRAVVGGTRLPSHVHAALPGPAGALNRWHSTNRSVPARVIVYRAGVGDGQLRTLVDYEVPQLLSSVTASGSQARYDPRVQHTSRPSLGLWGYMGADLHTQQSWGGQGGEDAQRQTGSSQALGHSQSLCYSRAAPAGPRQQPRQRKPPVATLVAMSHVATLIVVLHMACVWPHSRLFRM